MCYFQLKNQIKQAKVLRLITFRPKNNPYITLNFPLISAASREPFDDCFTRRWEKAEKYINWFKTNHITHQIIT